MRLAELASVRASPTFTGASGAWGACTATVAPMRLTLPLLSVCLLLPAEFLHAQDPFEIQVYEYETVPKGRWNLETHVNYVSKGTTDYEGPMAPTEGQFHTTFELTRGITDNFELAGYLLFGSYTGGSFQYAGARIRPRVSVPKEWGWPLGVSLSLEVGFPVKVFEENGTTLEIRPILEKKFGDWQIDINPVVGTALSGPGKGEWDFEPGAARRVRSIEGARPVDRVLRGDPVLRRRVGSPDLPGGRHPLLRGRRPERRRRLGPDGRREPARLEGAPRRPVLSR